MTLEKKCDLLRLIQFIDMAYRDKDINEQYRDVKKEKIARLYGNTARAKSTNN